ncbi:MAG: AAA family ATPase [Candidatus Glassbacteria bacterium]|nr:AAA family ATPase [Candidatus Glassbacteria bacterium]
MIESMRIFNYKSQKEIKLGLNPLNVLIGPNGCGKSNFIDLFSLISSGAKGELGKALDSRGGFDTVIYKGPSKTRTQLGFGIQFTPLPHFENIERENPESRIIYNVVISNLWNGTSVETEELCVTTNDEKITFVNRKPGECSFKDESILPLTRAFSGKDKEIKKIGSPSEFAIYQVKDELNHPLPYKVNKYLEEVAVYLPFDVSAESVVRRPQLVRPGTRLAPSGANLVSVLHSIQQNHQDVWGDISEILSCIYPGFRKISFPAGGGDGKILIQWYEEPFKELGFSINMISDGTVRLLLLLALLKSPDPPSLVCIDEPETGLHPSWIKLVGELLEEASTRTQLIVSTHSAELVSKMKPGNVVVCEKEDGASVMERLDEKELSEWLEKYTLGDLWLSGHFGG